MKFAAVTERLNSLGGAKWEHHMRARAMKAAGGDFIHPIWSYEVF